MTYRLKALMNIRREPSVESEKMGQKKEGALVSVISLENDWLGLEEGGFILFADGKFAERV